MNKRLIFIHGINNHTRTKAEIEGLWGDALREALGTRADGWWSDVQISTAYYADRLHEEVQDWPLINNPFGTRMSASSPEDDLAPPDVAALYLAFQEAHSLRNEQIAQELEPGDEVSGMRQAAGFHKKWIGAIARTLEKVVPSAGNGLARVTLSQAATYLNKPNVYDEINELVYDQVFADHKEGTQTVVVSHSLGTIIAYVLLRRMASQPDFPLFVTLGSPLGIEIVRRRIGNPLVNPPPAPKWVNGSDPEDFVALHKSLNADTFSEHVSITNYPDIENGHENAHSIAGYLRDARISETILSALKSPPI